MAQPTKCQACTFRERKGPERKKHGQKTPVWGTVKSRQEEKDPQREFTSLGDIGCLFKAPAELLFFGCCSNLQIQPPPTSAHLSSRFLETPGGRPSLTNVSKRPPAHQPSLHVSDSHHPPFSSFTSRKKKQISLTGKSRQLTSQGAGSPACDPMAKPTSKTTRSPQLAFLGLIPAPP